MDQKMYQHICKLIDQKEKEEAEQILLNLIQLDFQNPDCYFLFGNLYSQFQQFYKAKEMYEKCLSLQPSHFKCLYNYANLLADIQDYHSAKQCYKKALKIDKNDADVLNNLGILYLDNQEYDQAEIFFKRCIKQNPFNAKALNNLGLISYRLKWYRQAERYLQEALKISCDEPQSAFNLCLVQKKLGKHNNALENFMLYMCSTDDFNFRGLLKQIPYDLQDPSYRPKIAQMFYQFAQINFNFMEYCRELSQNIKESTTQAFELALQFSNSNDFNILSSYARYLHKKLKNLEKAGELYQIALQLEPDCCQFYQQYAEYLIEIGEKQHAFHLYLNGRKYRPDDRYFYNLAILASELKYNEFAQFGFLMALIIGEQPFLIKYSEKYAQFLFITQKYRAMVNVCQTYLRTQQLIISNIYSSYIKSLIFCGMYRQAKEHLKTFPNKQSQIYFILSGYLDFKTRNFQNAEQYYLYAIQLEQSPQILLRLGQLYLQLDQYEKAKEFFIKVYSLKEEKTLLEGGLLLAKAYQVSNMQQQAQNAYINLIKLIPQNSKVYRKYAQFCVKSNNKAEAYKAFEFALNFADGKTTCLLRAQIALFQFNLRGYVKNLLNCLYIDENILQANFMLAQHYLKVGKTKKARRYYEQTLRIDQYYIDAYEPYLCILFDAKELERAEFILNKLESMDKTKIYPIFKAKLLMNKNKFIAAENFLLKQIRSSRVKIPEELEQYYCYLGQIAKMTERYEKSGYYFLKSLAINPNNFQSLLGYAQTLSQSGNIKEANEKFRTINKLFPSLQNTLLYLQFLERNNQNNTIIQYCQFYLENYPQIFADTIFGQNKEAQNIQQFYIKYASSLQKQKLYQKAEEFYIKCINRNSKSVRCKKKLANLLIKQGRCEEAEKYFYNGEEEQIVNETNNKCKVCLVDEAKFINVQCGHFCVCEECASKINQKCPICRTSGNFCRVYQ